MNPAEESAEAYLPFSYYSWLVAYQWPAGPGPLPAGSFSEWE
jgi:hypothetical protein